MTGGRPEPLHPDFNAGRLPAAGLGAPDASTIDGWRRAWHTMMSSYLPDSEGALSAVFDTIQPRTPPDQLRLLDLGGGPGTVTERVLGRWPDATVTLLDLDPVLLALAQAALPSTAVVAADLATPAWRAFLTGRFDVVLAVMTVHYFPPQRIRALYREIRSTLRSGGTLVVVDDMRDLGSSPPPATVRRDQPHGGSAWNAWWREVRSHPAMATLVSQRDDLFDHRTVAEFTAQVTWHHAALRDAGFTDTAVRWRHGTHTAIAATVSAHTATAI